MSKEKIRGAVAGKVETVVGALLTLLFLATVLRDIGSRPRMLWYGFMFLFLALFILFKGLEWGKLVGLCRAYSAVLASDSSKSISDLASVTGETVSEAKKNLQLMIKRGMLVDIAIDESNGAIIDGKRVKMAQDDNVQASSTVASSCEGVVAGEVVVQCPSCGAKNSMPQGSTASCGHCGAAIHS